MESTSIQAKAPNPIEALFKGVNGSLPLILYLGPVIVWVSLFLLIGFDGKAMSRQVIQATASNMLQEDINLISEQVKDTEFFKMTKEDIIKSNQNDNFLFKKAKSKIEKSQASKSVGTYDDEIVRFDQALNPIIESKIEQEDSLGVNISDLNYEMNKMKEDRNYKYEQKKQEIALAERQRKAKIQQAIEDNRNKKATKEKQAYDEYQLELAAYEQSVNAYHNNHNKGITSYPNEQSTPSNQTKNKEKPTFGFNTATGIKDDLNLYQKDKAVPQIDSTVFQNKPSPPLLHANNDQNSIATQVPLFASIDQARKVRSGQKVQIRIIEDGFYQGLFIPANSIIYGICTINSNRINITVPSINYNDEILRTNMIAYDMDGIQGIYVDGSFNDITRDVLNEGLRSGGSIGLRGSNNPLGNLSINLGRKANNKVSVHIPTGYKILLYHGSVNQTTTNNQFGNNPFTNSYSSENAYGY